jgi:hypothetical protein
MFVPRAAHCLPARRSAISRVADSKNQAYIVSGAQRALERRSQFDGSWAVLKLKKRGMAGERAWEGLSPASRPLGRAGRLKTPASQA